MDSNRLGGTQGKSVMKKERNEEDRGWGRRRKREEVEG